MKKDVFGIEKELDSKKGKFKYFSLAELEKKGHKVSHLPFSIRVLLENAIRNCDGFNVVEENIHTILNWKPKTEDIDIPFMPGRVLMQDFTGVPAVVSMASIRAEAVRKGKQPKDINPLIPVDLVIDHSVQVANFGTEDSLAKNVALEFEQNVERYELLKWAQKAFNNFSVVPPGMGICHQVNLEYLGQTVANHEGYAFPDTCVGTDSHTPMVNGAGIIAWGVGGIEAEAAMLGQAIVMQLPEVIGLKLTGDMPAGTTATDLVLTITEIVRKYGVVGKFVEVFGKGLDNLNVTDRATISNMSPEFGNTVTFFPIDQKTIDFLRKTGRSEEQCDLVEKYAKANMFWRENEDLIQYTDVITVDLAKVVPTISGPKRPQDRISLTDVKPAFEGLIKKVYNRDYVSAKERETFVATAEKMKGTIVVDNNHEEYLLHDGSIVLAAITSCTNTSNPSVMIAAGIVAKKAAERGMKVPPYVKTSLAPGSRVVTEYLEKTGLQQHLNQVGFNLVGYGCTTCIGNSGPLDPSIEKQIVDNDLIAASVLSGNRNFEARVHQNIKANFLMSPPLVVAFALAGTVLNDVNTEPIGKDRDGNDVYLRDIWASLDEVKQVLAAAFDPSVYKELYSQFAEQNPLWNSIESSVGQIYEWDRSSTYIQEPPFFENFSMETGSFSDIHGARALAIFGDSVTTDHISPAGAIKANSPAGLYLQQQGVAPADFNSYGSRRGNDRVMLRGTFANVRIKNLMAAPTEGGFTRHQPDGAEMTIYDAAMQYDIEKVPLFIFAGKEYGTGSSRDWAAKGTSLMGVKAVITESFERIHRSNLVGMGVLPLQFKDGQSAGSLGLDGTETFALIGLESGEVRPRQDVTLRITRADGSETDVTLILRIDTPIEIEYYKNGGILPYVLRQLIS